VLGIELEEGEGQELVGGLLQRERIDGYVHPGPPIRAEVELPRGVS
jgi:hypothetical protein